MPEIAPQSVMRWRQLCEEWAAKYPNLIWQEICASLSTESTGNPLAFNHGDPSWGLFGVERPIAETTQYGGPGFAPGDDSWKTDPEKNASCAVPFLAHLQKEFGNCDPPYGWIGAYNCGETQFRKGFRDGPYVTMWTNRLMQINSSMA